MTPCAPRSPTQTCAVIIEPIQGEGGIRVVPDQCLKGLRDLCDETGTLLIFDEVQCGMGRTGRLFAHEWSGVTPDIMMVAKGIGGGFPLGAVLATEDAASGMVAGTHGSTYGGNPLACAVGAKVVEIITAPGFLDKVSAKGARFRQGLEGLVAAHPQGVRGGARSGPDPGPEMPGAQYRCGQGRLRRTPADRPRRRQCHPPVARAEHRRCRYHRSAQASGRRGDRGRTKPLIPFILPQILHGGPEFASAKFPGVKPPALTKKNDMKHFLDIHKTDAADLRHMINSAMAMKTARNGRPKGEADDEQPLAGRMVALIFEKPSTRTRVTFDVGVRQMGGQTMVLSGKEMQLGHGETIADTARVLSRYVDLIMIRTFEEATLLEMAEHATVPVINGLTNRTHPCQIMADVMTYEEHRGPIAGRARWSGRATATMSAPRSCMPPVSSALTSPLPGRKRLIPKTNSSVSPASKGSKVIIERDPALAVAGADLVVTDTWVSMHDPESAKERRHNQLSPYQVNEALMARAKPDALFMHCLPAHRNDEVDQRRDGRPAFGGL